MTVITQNHKRYFDSNKTAKELHFTSDGFAFYLPDTARNHADRLKNKTVTLVTRAEYEAGVGASGDLPKTDDRTPEQIAKDEAKGQLDAAIKEKSDADAALETANAVKIGLDANASGAVKGAATAGVTKATKRVAAAVEGLAAAQSAFDKLNTPA